MSELLDALQVALAGAPGSKKSLDEQEDVSAAAAAAGQDVILTKRRSVRRRKAKLTQHLQAEQELKEKKAQKLAIYNKWHVPTVRQPPAERALQKIATQGVVQLFNAINKEQGSLAATSTNKGRHYKRKQAAVAAAATLAASKLPKHSSAAPGSTSGAATTSAGASATATAATSSAAADSWLGLNKDLSNANWDQE